MKTARFACLFLVLAAPIFGQSNPQDKIRRQPTTSMPSRTLHGEPVAERAATLASARRGISPQTLGLSFAPAVTYATGGSGDYTYALAIADVNNDGKPDLIATNYIVPLGVLLGNGDGTFKPPVPVPVEARNIAAGDLDGDGNVDLVTSNYGGSVSVLMGLGNASFTAVTYPSGGYGANSIAIADVNHDGKPDIVVVNDCMDNPCTTEGSVAVLLGNGDGTFQTAITYSTGGFIATSLAVADFNRDGKLDLVVANRCGYDSACNNELGSVAVFLGNGDGTFAPPNIYQSGGDLAFSTVATDANGDGIPDIVVANACANDCFDDSVIRSSRERRRDFRKCRDI